MVAVGTETQEFISKHREADVRDLALRPGNVNGVDLPLALRQIGGRQMALRKLPSWAAVEGLLYPPRLSMEQCSSERTARYKAALAGGGGSLVDLTGGFGVDFSFMCRGFGRAVYVERQVLLCEIASHNFALLGLNHTEVVSSSADDYLEGMAAVDCVYLDPARRDQYGRKVVSVADCDPDLSLLLPRLLAKSKTVLVKYSPMLDLSSVCSSLRGIREVHVVAVDNECKELLFLFDAESRADDLRIVCASLGRGGDALFSFSKAEETASACCFATSVGRYLYEPNAALMKGGAYKLLTQRFPVGKLDLNTHLYTSDDRVADFPGRCFEVEACFSLGKSELKHHLAGVKSANLAVRNFPQTVAQLRAKLKLAEGGDLYLFATTIAGKRVLVKGRRCP